MPAILSKPARLLSAGFALIATAMTWAQLPKSEFPIERFYQYPLLQGRSPSAPAMSPDGSRIAFGWNKTGIRKLDLWVLEYPNGTPKQIVEAAKIDDLPRQDDTRTEQEKKEAELYDGGIGSAQWSPDGKELMFGYKGRTWLVKPDGSDLRPLFDGRSSIGGPRYSEDGKSINYTDGQNIFRMDRETGRTKQLTFLSKPQTSISTFELSPDGKYIFVNWSDSSKMGRHVMMDFSKDRATVVNIQRMWNGDLPVDEQFGVISAEGGVVKFIKDIPRYLWVASVAWSPDSSKLALGWYKDDFKEYTISVVDPAKNEKVDVYTEKAPKNYINDWREVAWTRDGKKILFGTDIINGQFANRSLLSMDPDGKNVAPVYAEKHDIGAWARPKKSDRLILVTAARSPLKTEITIIEPNGKRVVYMPVTDGYCAPKGFNDSGLPLFSEDGKRIATLASNRQTPWELYSVGPNGKRLTISQLPDFAKIKWAEFKEVSFPGPEGRTIHGILISKPGLDKSKKHPAILSNMYADSGKAAWGGFMENFAAMELDMVVLCVDFRSSWGYDGEFNSGYYQKMGLVDADEAVAAKKFLASMPYVREDRVGLWGWSYGGFLTCMTMLTKPGEFHAGVAVASVTDWKSYNEWYTRRRLGLVKDDKDKVFEKTSPITYADGLKDNLLLVHGMLDDNVLFQDTARLMQKLIDAGKYFDVMAYPRDDHGIGKDSSRPHVQAVIMRYLYEKLSK